MPDGALHACTYPRCPRLLGVGELCPDHQPRWAWRDPTLTTTQRGYGREWQLRRARILKRDGYVCQPCQREGRSIRATSVDHIVPKSQDGTDNDANLEACCEPHHLAKSARERRRG